MQSELSGITVSDNLGRAKVLVNRIQKGWFSGANTVEESSSSAA
jgi:hypothetical protein